MKSWRGQGSTNNWKTRKKRLHEDLVMALDKQKRVSEELQKSNKELEEDIKNLEDYSCAIITLSDSW